MLNNMGTKTEPTNRFIENEIFLSNRTRNQLNKSVCTYYLKNIEHRIFKYIITQTNYFISLL